MSEDESSLSDTFHSVIIVLAVNAVAVNTLSLPGKRHDHYLKQTRQREPERERQGERERVT